MDKTVIIDNCWFENPKDDSRPEHRDPYEFVNSTEYLDPDNYNIM